jgi:ElaB/YqjD/DUF883 family membrane-anchored ribosome-binding protein
MEAHADDVRDGSEAVIQPYQTLRGNTLLKDAKDRIIDRLDEFATEFNKPLQDASRKSGETIEQLNTRISTTLEVAAKQFSDETAQLSKSTATIIASIERVVSKLTSLQTPDQIIEIKLNPAIQGISRAVNNFSKSAEVQAGAVDSNLKQTQALLSAITMLLSEISARRLESLD